MYHLILSIFIFFAKGTPGSSRWQGRGWWGWRKRAEGTQRIHWSAGSSWTSCEFTHLVHLSIVVPSYNNQCLNECLQFHLSYRVLLGTRVLLDLLDLVELRWESLVWSTNTSEHMTSVLLLKLGILEAKSFGIFFCVGTPWTCWSIWKRWCKWYPWTDWTSRPSWTFWRIWPSCKLKPFAICV